MQRSQALFVAVDPQVLASGLLPDVQSVLKPLWVTGTGARFVNGKVRRKRQNTRLIADQSGKIRGIGQQTLLDRTQVVWFVARNILWRWDGTYLQSIGDPLALSAMSPFVDFTFYGNWAFINTSIGTVKFYNGATLGTIIEMPINVVLVRKFLSFILCFGTGTRGTGVSWSDANDITKWLPQPTNSASSIYFDNFDSAIVSAAPLGSRFAVYSQGQMGVLSFIGDPFYFGQQTVRDNIGATGKFAVTSEGGVNYGVSRNGVWRTDGSEYQFIDSGKMHTYLQDNVAWPEGARIIAARNDRLHTIDFSFPMNGGSVESWSFDPASNSWTLVPAVYMQDEVMLFKSPLVASENGWIEQLDNALLNTDTLSLITKPILLQLQSESGLADIHTDSSIDEIELLLHKVQNVEMRIGSSRDHAGTVHWSTWMPLEIGKSSYLVPRGVPDGVYWRLEFRSTVTAGNVQEDGDTVLEDGEQVTAHSVADSWDLDLQGFMLYGTPRGAK